MKVAAKRQKDVVDLNHIVKALQFQEPGHLVELAYAKHGDWWSCPRVGTTMRLSSRKSSVQPDI